MRTASPSTRPVTRIISADKSGRVLSSANAKAIQDSLDQLRAVLKKAGIDDAAAEMQVKEFAEKCGMDVGDMPMPEMYAKPYGGATTFEEVQAYESAQESSEDLSELTSKFQAIYQNIMADEDMSPSERAAAITQAASDFATAAQDPEASDTDEKSVGIMARVKEFLTGEKANDNHDEHGRFASGGGGSSDIYMRNNRTDQPHSHAVLEHHNLPADVKKGVAKGADSFTHSHDSIHAGGQHGHTGSGGPVYDKQLTTAEATASDAAARERMNAQGKAGQNRVTKEITDEPGAFASFKDASGEWRWAATWSNNFYDRDGEVFPESAHKDYEAYVDRTGDYPELQLWHIPGSKCGKADMIAYDDGMMLATGTWDEDKSDIAAAFARSKDLGVSHGYTYAPHDVVRGAYRHYRTFEISPLPGKKAANIGTNFTAFAAKEEAPMLTAEKRQWLVEKIGEDRATAIEENHQRMRKDLADKGISYKEFVEALVEGDDAGTKAEDPKVEVKADAPAVPAEAAKEVEPLYAPGFKSEDGGKTWTAHKAEDEPKDDEKVEEKPAEAVVADAAKEASPVLDAAALVTAVKEANAPIFAELKAIRDEFSTKVDAIKTGRDDVIAQAWSNKQWGRDVKSATEREDNIIVDSEKARATIAEINGEESTDPALPYVKDLMDLVTSGAGIQQ